MNYDLILVRYGEMTLKKDNYKQFKNQIVGNLRRKLETIEGIRMENTDYRYYIYLNGVDYKIVLEKLNEVVGLHSYSLCSKVEADYDMIAQRAEELIRQENDNLSFTFKVETNRGNKNFPATSIDISREVAKRVLVRFKDVKVDVHNPDVTLNIDLRTEGTYIYTKTIKGLGGYPANMAGGGLVMMSGGIDSPVATYLAIRKGVKVYAIHFASPPYTSDMALQKVVDLLERLTEFTANGEIELLVVPFTKVQDKIHQNAREDFMITIMRRCMYKIASMVCKRKNIHIIINGESIGQVASQTLESMEVVNEVTNIPILRPVATYDKQEIIDIAKKIKTFDISIRPYEDCCTVFVPTHPVIKPRLEDTLRYEADCDLEDEILDAFNNIETIKLTNKSKYNVFDTNDKFEL